MDCPGQLLIHALRNPWIVRGGKSTEIRDSYLGLGILYYSFQGLGKATIVAKCTSHV